MFKTTARGKIILLATSLFLLTTGATVAKSPADFTVHEWGTFLAMNGSDGVTLDGMYHEEHALPAFVHERSKDQLRVPAVSVKGETPVIYFYTDTPRDVQVRVRFPRGLWTQWYPQAEYNGPLTAQAGSPPELKHGHITWQVRITPPGVESTSALPRTELDSLWNYAREVDAAFVRPNDRYVKARGEAERFIFYRGLGEATLPLKMTTLSGSVLSYDREEPLPLRHVFIIRVEHGRAVYRYVPALQPGESVKNAIPSMSTAQPLAEFSQKITDDLAGRLTEAGLYAREARAMANTWKRSYFETDGIRVLFVLPQAWTEKFIPIEITPRPAQVVRVMVGRMEVLTPEREAAAAEAVRNLAATDAVVRERAYEALRDQGRYLEPILRRTLKTTGDASVRRLCSRLLTTDFITELRAVLNARNGSNQREGELDARAQLASLLREVGLNGQAEEEARNILPEISRMTMPPVDNSAFRPYARIQARTMEALGDDAAAAKWYSQFVKFGSQSVRCGGCHGSQGPTGMAWYRDWWAGRKYAYYTSRTEGVEAGIVRQLAALKADPNDPAVKMMLAYLYDYKGDASQAANLWARINKSASAGQVSFTQK